MNTKLCSWLLVSALSLAVGVGCGDDDVEPGPAETTPSTTPDMGSNTTPDMGEPPPSVVPPSYLTLDIDPGRAVYVTGNRLLIDVTVYDAFGEPTDELEYQLTVDPPTASEQLDNGRWELLEEGIVTFEACTNEPDRDGERACASRTIAVNDSPPDITITSPLPGAQLDATNNPMIVVEGEVSDTYGEELVWVRGTPVEVQEDGTFSTEVTPRFGINHIDVVASDGVRPDDTKVAVDVVWGNDYLPATPDSVEVAVANAIRLRLGQRFFDDGMRTGSAPDGSIVTRDLADILELLVREIDFISQIPNPVVDSGGFTLGVTDVRVGKPVIMLDVTDTGLEFFIQVPDMVIDTTGSFTLNNQSLDLTGNLTARVAILAVLDVDKPNAMEPLTVTVSQLEVAVEDAMPSFASPEANAVFELASSALRTTIETLLIDTLRDAFVDQLPTLLTDVLGALDTALADQTFDLDTGLGAPLSLELDAGLSNVETRFRDGLYADLDATVRVPDAMPTFPQTRGTPRLFTGDAPDPFYTVPRMQFALSLPFVNSLLHTLWNAGLLDADISDVVPVQTDRAVISGKLAPVIRPPRAGEVNDFVLEVGQLELTIEFLGSVDTYGVYLGAGVDFGIDNGALTLTVADEPVIDVWLISTTSDTLFLTPEALESLMLTELWPSITDAIAQGLSIPLPAPDVGGLGTLAPSLQNLTLSFEQTRDVEIREGHLAVEAELVGTVPNMP
jgi:hypothetical protein